MSSTLPLTFDEAHACYTPAPGMGMTRPQALAFLRRYEGALRQAGNRVATYIAAQTGQQPVWLHYPDDEEQVRLFDADELVRHVTRRGATGDRAVVGYVHYRSGAGEYHLVALWVEWESERVVIVWSGPIRPPDWGDDQTPRQRWVERPEPIATA